MKTIFAQVMIYHPSQPPADLTTVERHFPRTESVDEDHGLYNIEVADEIADELERDGVLDWRIGSLWVHAEMP